MEYPFVIFKGKWTNIYCAPCRYWSVGDREMPCSDCAGLEKSNRNYFQTKEGDKMDKPFKVGDTVRLIVPEGVETKWGRGGVKTGEIGTVLHTRAHTNGSYVIDVNFPSHHNWIVHPSEIELVRDDSFKVGDRIVVIERCDRIEVGNSGTIVYITTNAVTPIGIEFDKLIGLHGCDGHCKDGYGYYLPEKNIKKLEVSGMKIDEKVREELVKNLIDFRSGLVGRYDKSVNVIIKATTVEEIMQANKDILLELTNLPYGCNYCSFCLKHKGHCDNCEYGKHHGICNYDNSDFGKIRVQRDKLMQLIKDLYYKGETYDDELKPGDLVKVIDDASWSYVVKDGKLTMGGDYIEDRPDVRYKIIETGLTLPTAPSRVGRGKSETHNDTIIQNTETGEVIFIQKRFLERA